MREMASLEEAITIHSLTHLLLQIMLKFCPIVQMKFKQVFWTIILWKSFEYSLGLSWQWEEKKNKLHTVRTVPKNTRMIVIKLWSRKLVCTSSVLSDKISAFSTIIKKWRKKKFTHCIRVGRRMFEGMSQTMYRIEAWLRLTGNDTLTVNVFNRNYSAILATLQITS
jgi:hypothetical protein